MYLVTNENGETLARNATKKQAEKSRKKLKELLASNSSLKEKHGKLEIVKE